MAAKFIDVRSDIASVVKGFEQYPKQIRQATVTGINRATASARSAFVREATSIVNIKAKDLRPFVRITRATVRKGGATGTIEISVRAVPASLFGAKVRMQNYDVTAFGKYPVRRKLPTVYIKLYKKDKFEKLAGVFPLRQRTTGKLNAEDKLKRRTGRDRGKLTGIRFRILPPELVRTRLLPVAAAAGAAAFVVQFRSAFRNRLDRLRQPPG